MRKLLFLFVFVPSLTFAQSYMFRGESGWGGNPDDPNKLRLAQSTCTAIDKHHLLTNFHCVASSDPQRLYVFCEGSWTQCEIEKESQSMDLVLLKTKANLKYHKLTDKIPKKDEEVSMTCSSEGLPLKTHKGKIIDNNKALFDEVKLGNSGSPLIVNDKIIGILRAEKDNVGYFIDSKTIEDFLKK